MKKRICPVCDSEMKWGHFCFGCRQWIREPKIVEVNYYLNERHPRGETDCLYHNGPEAEKEGKTDGRREVRTAGREETQREAVRKMPKTPRNTSEMARNTSETPRDTSEMARAPRMPRGAQKQKASTGKLTVLIVVVVYAVLMMLLPLISSLFSAFTRFY